MHLCVCVCDTAVTAGLEESRGLCRWAQTSNIYAVERSTFPLALLLLLWGLAAAGIQRLSLLPPLAFSLFQFHVLQDQVKWTVPLYHLPNVTKLPVLLSSRTSFMRDFDMCEFSAYGQDWHIAEKSVTQVEPYKLIPLLEFFFVIN